MNKFFSFIRDYFSLNFLKYGSKGIRIGFIASLNFAVLSIHTIVLLTVLNYVLKFYSFINSFFDFINHLDFIFIKILHSIYFFKAFNDVFNIFAPFFVSIIYIYCSSFLVRTLEKFRNSIDSLNLARID